jgi:hypothetical protein
MAQKRWQQKNWTAYSAFSRYAPEIVFGGEKTA